jgi:glyoxylase-like metal-dependent hydrolase (beta-lactamase superfamily II)
MRRITSGIYQWSVFNEEKGLDFNGLYLKTKAGPVLVDPPPLGPEEIKILEKMGAPRRIYLTNKHHTRDAAAHRARWRAKLLVPKGDQPLMEIPSDGIFADGQIIADEIQVIQIPDAKTPGECALYWPQKKLLILGDAIISKADGLAMLPDGKFKDPAAARRGLRVLNGLNYEILLVGDGKPILEKASQVVAKFLDQF